ncbi:UPF0160 protein-like protein [Tanacetum coccineum]
MFSVLPTLTKLFKTPNKKTFTLSVLMAANSFSTSLKKVGTHNGSFHCDEALGCFMIRLTDKYSGAEIVRSRDPQVLESLDAVLDVGGVYDPSNDRYDHHQKGFAEVFGHGFTTKLSSAGLIYKHFGLEIIAKELQVDEGHPDVHRLFLAIYKSFMEWKVAWGGYSDDVPRYAIDAIDNGINQYDTDQPAKYVNNTHLSSRVGRFNLDWTDPDQSSEKENEAFQKAMALAGSEFLDSVRFHVKSWLPARSIVMECLAARTSIDPSGEIMVLDRFCPWKLHLYELEQELKTEPTVKYVLYRALPAQWRGLRDDDLSKQSGISDCVFVHMSGFIGGNHTYEGALAMARGALKL